MSNPQDEIKFPTKRPMNEMGKLLDAPSLDNIRVTNKRDRTLLEAPVRVDIGGMIPKVFKAPFKAIGFGVSVLAKLLGVGVVVDPTKVSERSDE
jgi:hypothetical protein